MARAEEARRRPRRLVHDNSLLRTKIVAPQQAKHVVIRPRLLNRLTDGLNHPVTLLAAPAGSGKTMLLASWIRSRRVTQPIAWYSLDALDNNHTRFWTYILESLRTSGAVPRGSILATLAAPRAQHQASFLAKLLGGLTELRATTVLVLDDFHLLTDPLVLDDLRLLVRHDLPTLRVVLATREDPDLPLSWVRVRNGLNEIRAADLAFTTEEARELLGDINPALSDQDVAIICERTEGWAAGLRIAALSIQAGEDPHEFVAEFGAGDRAVADYLVSEVLARHSEEEQEFLLQTSIVDTLSGSLADAITGRIDSQRVLERLERANAFVTALGSHRRWFRFHQLLVELLRLELVQRMPDRVPELHQRAARWFVENGMAAEAIAHASRAGSWAFTADLVVDNWFAMHISGNGGVLRDLLAQVPSRIVETRPELAVGMAATRIDSGDVVGADEYLRLAEANESLVQQHRRRPFAESMTYVRLYLSRIRGDLGDAVLSARQVLSTAANGLAMGSGSDDVRAATLANLGAAEMWTGDFLAAATHLEDGLAAAWRVGIEYIALDCLSQLAALEAIQGRMVAAEERARSAIELAERRGWTTLPPVASAYAAVAVVHFNRNELAESERALELAERANAHAHERAIDMGIALMRSYIFDANGDTSRARTMLRVAEQDAQRIGRPDFVDVVLRSNEPRLLAEEGDTDKARSMLESSLLDKPTAEVAVQFARLQLANRETRAAIDTLKPLLDGSLTSTHSYSLIEAWLYDAVARHSLGLQEEALRSLEYALELGEAEGRRRLFTEAGPAMRDLLSMALRKGTSHRSFAGQILDDLEGRLAGEASASLIMVEPLSDRERTVLRFLPTMLSSREIAAELYLSVNTVKTHMKNIYRKLAASGRRDAVQRARRQRLL